MASKPVNNRASAETERRFRNLFENMLNGYAYCKMDFTAEGEAVDFTYLEVNDAFSKLTGLYNVTGKKVTEVIPGIRLSNPEIFRIYGKCASTGEPDVFETFIGPIEEWLKVSVYSPQKGFFAAIFEDITEHIKAEELHQRYELIVKNSKDIILFMCADDGRLLEANDTAVKEYGYSLEELLKMKIQDLRAPETREMTREQMNEAEDHGIVFETVHMRHDGSTFPVEVSSSGAVIGGVRTLISIVRDISGRKNEEKALLSLQTGLKQAEELAHVGAWWIDISNFEDINSNPLYWSDEVFRIFGYEPGEVNVTNDLFFSHVHPLDRELVRKAVSDSMTSKKSYNIEHRILRPDGSERVVLEHADFSFDKNGTIVRINGAVQDITERKKAEDLLQKSEERYRGIIEQLNDIYFRANREGILTMLSPSGTQLGYGSIDEMIGRPTRIFFEVPEQRDELFNEIYRKGSVRDYELTLKKSDNTPMPVSLSSHILRDSEGKPIGTEGVIRDISKRKQDEEKLQQSLREKEVLLRELYHRTKNNMQVIIAILNLEASYFTDEFTRDVFKSIENRIHSMALVHQKLYQSQNLSSINLKEYINDLISLLAESYEIKENKIKFELDIENISVGIDTAIPCGLIINELVSNSFKYAFPGDRKGMIHLGLARDNNGFIEIRIEDNGIGMPPDFDFRTGGKMGIKSVFSIGEQQLRGKVDFSSGQGLSCVIRFIELPRGLPPE